MTGVLNLEELPSAETVIAGAAGQADLALAPIDRMRADAAKRKNTEVFIVPGIGRALDTGAVHWWLEARYRRLKADNLRALRDPDEDPAGFNERILLASCEEVILRGEEGERWPLACRYDEALARHVLGETGQKTDDDGVVVWDVARVPPPLVPREVLVRVVFDDNEPALNQHAALVYAWNIGGNVVPGGKPGEA